ncbi:hypothetical protein CspHIS471_0208420 [Cutaneotrichosporon sp. HIS471]|nr:hypothetical protein CspHIS471_0208420 [Cutaneotrichosporon sp. HIS471]
MLLLQHLECVGLAKDPVGELKVHRVLLACAGRPEIGSNGVKLAEHRKYLPLRLREWVRERKMEEADIA